MNGPYATIKIICIPCGCFIGGFGCPQQFETRKEYDDWMAMNRAKKQYCRHCRRHVTVTFQGY